MNRQQGFFADPSFNTDGHSRIISRSRERSKAYGIDPAMAKAPEHNRLTKPQLQQRIRESQPFFDLVTRQMATLYSLLKGSGFSMAVSDHEGYILHILGDAAMIAQYKKRNCVPGYRWTERDLGTCAIGLALEILTPVQVSGEEMYSLSAHHITNSAAPVFDPGNKLLGVIALSGDVSQVHTHTLGMVILAAETIRSQISEYEKSRELALRNKYMTALLESDNRGVIALDKQGHIIQLNRTARLLLGTMGADDMQEITALVNSNRELTAHLKQGKAFWEKELTYTWGKTRQTLISSLDPIALPDAGTAGGLLLLMGKKRIMKLVNNLAGFQAHFTFDAIIGNSPALREAVTMAEVAAKGTAAVLLYGETGTGKELFAQAIHNAGPRQDKPFVVINCGAIPRELLESELFGYAEGAFTGAQKGGRPGKFELADGGTLFLDEIGDMPMDMQVKILRALQSGEIYRVGGSHPIMVDLRIISATNVDLDNAISGGDFRQDLFYRISTFRIDIPALHRRKSDIPELAHAFLARFRNTEGAVNSPGTGFSQTALDRMTRYTWPGNIRQLENTVERAANMAGDRQIRARDLGIAHTDDVDTTLVSGKESLLKNMEKQVISNLMETHGGNVSKVSRLLGISRPTLYRKLAVHGLKQDK